MKKKKKGGEKSKMKVLNKSMGIYSGFYILTDK